MFGLKQVWPGFTHCIRNGDRVIVYKTFITFQTIEHDVMSLADYVITCIVFMIQWLEAVVYCQQPELI